MSNVQIPDVNRKLVYWAHGSADGKYPSAKRGAEITDVETPGDPHSRVKFVVLNPTGLFFHPEWATIQQPGDERYGAPGTINWPVFTR